MTAGGKGEGADIRPEAPVFRRLLDDSPVDPESPGAWAIDLLRRVAPYRTPVGRRQRVQLGLGYAVGRRRRSPLLRPAIAGVVLIGCGAAASAALGRWPDLVAQAYRRLLAPPASLAPASAESRAHRGASGLSVRQSSPAASDWAPTAEVAVAPVAAMPDVSPAPGRQGARAPSASWRPRRAPKVVSAEDTTPVLEAMRALRVDGNPARARRLLSGYLGRHPRGTLAEEALAMSIEAAVAQGDGDAPTLAHRYLRRYPAGHFSLLARQTLDAGPGVHR